MLALMLPLLVTLSETRPQYGLFPPTQEPGIACTKCCTGGAYEHGNEKCGLTVDSHSFSYSLLDNLVGRRKQNAVISPFSIMNILLLVSLGSNGRTRDEIRSVLKFPLYFPPEHDHLMMKCALQRYDGVSVHTANAIFYERSKTSTRESFLQQAARYYNATVKGVSFYEDSFSAWMSIADFLRDHTKGFIDNAFQETSIAELVFLNTVYFNGTWNFNVKSESVSKMVFHRAYSEPIVVEALHVTEVFNTATIDDFLYYGDTIKIVELPYSDHHFSMFIFMPEHGRLSMRFVEDVIRKWTVSGIKHYLMSQEMLNLTLPTFSLQYEADIAPALANMGLKSLFSREADLTNLFEQSNIYADKLIHKAKITVSPSGTEAASATFIGVNRSGYAPRELTFKYPFNFVIFDNCNNLILFQGRCADPARAAG